MKAIDVNEAVWFDPVRPTGKTLVDTPQARVVLFSLQAGQAVPTHGAEAEVIFYTLRGNGTATIGDEEVALAPGVLVCCPPSVPHGLRSEGDLVVMATIAPRPW